MTRLQAAACEAVPPEVASASRGRAAALVSRVRRGADHIPRTLGPRPFRDFFDIVINGYGAHGAMPEGAVRTSRLVGASDRGGLVPATRLGAPEVEVRSGFYSFALPTDRSARLAAAAAVLAGLCACAMLALGLHARPAPALEPATLTARAEIAAPAPRVAPAPVAPAPVPPDAVALPLLEPPHPRVFALDDPLPLRTPPVPEAAEPAPARPAEPARAEPAHPADAPVAFAGVWGPTDSACSPRANKGNYLPAVIDAQGAFAGETSCAFRNARTAGAGWTVSATCSSPKGRWATQVRLVVAGNHLTWSSSRGRQTYVRCGSVTRRAEQARTNARG